MLKLPSLALIFIATGSGAPFQSGGPPVDNRGGIAVMYGENVPTQGSGRRVRQIRPSGSFTRIVADDAVDLEVRIGGGSSVEIEADDNLIGRMTVRTSGGVLRLGVRGGYRTTAAPLARVTLPRLDRVDLQSSSSARIYGLSGGRLKLTSTGSGSFHAQGWVESVGVVMEGSGDADLDGLDAATVGIVLNGSGSARVRARNALAATVNGTGRIVYRGDPATVSRSVNGPGNIQQAGD